MFRPNRFNIGDVVTIKKPSRPHYKDELFRIARVTTEKSVRRNTVYPVFELMPITPRKRLEKWMPWEPSWNLQSAK